jgi:hypothetical protein
MRRARQSLLRVPRTAAAWARAGGQPVSSAILYLAIIAIWAGVLIPRWLKRDTSQAKKSKWSRGQPADADADAGGAGVHMVADAEAGTEAGGRAGSRRGGARDELDDGRATDDFAEYEDEAPAGYRPADPEARTRILAARRRMLMILLALAGLALGIVVIGMAAWWVAVPPVLMLGGYLLLLREASRADAERAQVLADAAAYREEDEERRQADQDAAERAEAERAAAERRAEPRTARIFDISERVRDEFYDQYADAERRAVGD